MYISSKNKNTYTPGEPLDEVWELQIKKALTYTWTVRSFYHEYIFIQFGYELLFSLFITNRHFPEETTSK